MSRSTICLFCSAYAFSTSRGQNTCFAWTIKHKTKLVEDVAAQQAFIALLVAYDLNTGQDDVANLQVNKI